MKASKVVVLSVILLILITPLYADDTVTLGLDPPSLSDPINDNSNEPEEKSKGGSITTVGQWQRLDEFNRDAFILGLLKGHAIAEVLTSGETYDARKKKLYLIAGWNMNPSDYAQEMGVILEDQNTKIKSISVTLIQAEANFAKNAGQKQRAKALEARKYDIVYVICSINDKNEILHISKEDMRTWHTMEGLGVVNSVIAGVIQGISLCRIEITKDVKDRPYGFRMGQISRKMNDLSKSYGSNDSILELFIAANKALIEQATVK